MLIFRVFCDAPDIANLRPVDGWIFGIGCRLRLAKVAIFITECYGDFIVVARILRFINRVEIMHMAPRARVGELGDFLVTPVVLRAIQVVVQIAYRRLFQLQQFFTVHLIINISPDHE